MRNSVVFTGAVLALGLLSGCTGTNSTSNDGSPRKSLTEITEEVAAISAKRDRADLAVMIPQCVNVMNNRQVNTSSLATRKILPAKLLLGQQVYENWISSAGIGTYAQYVRLAPFPGKGCHAVITMSLKARYQAFRQSSGELLQANGFKKIERKGFVGQTITEYVSADGLILAKTLYTPSSRTATLAFSKK